MKKVQRKIENKDSDSEVKYVPITAPPYKLKKKYRSAKPM